jgi:hypothetical protein
MDSKSLDCRLNGRRMVEWKKLCVVFADADVGEEER